MNLLSKEHINSLINKNLTPCVTIYLPTEKAGKDVIKGKILLKNLLRESENKLKELNHPDLLIKEILKGGYGLVEDSFFWQNCDDGLAIFMSEKSFDYFKIPLNFSEKVFVSNHFNVVPLLSFLTSNKSFYILSLSQKQIKLYEADKFSISEIDLKDIPTSLEEALQIDNPERQLQYHSGASGNSSAVYHGYGGATEDNKAKILRFMQKISEDILPFMENKESPLLISGVEYILSIYKDTNKYPNLIEEYIEGSPDSLNLKELKERSEKIIDSHIKKPTKNILDKYQLLKVSGKITELIPDIVSASHEGRVQELLLSSDAQAWGFYDESNQITTYLPEGDPKSENILNLAAINTLKTGGNVYVVHPEELIEGHPQIAVLRY